MNKKRIIILILLVLVAVSIYFIFFNKPDADKPNSFGKMQNMSSENIGNKPNSNQGKTTTLSQTSEIKSASTEKVELHATYYLEEVFVEENQYVEAGSNILKYTNGTYLTAPYNCCITGLNLPDINNKCLNSHYIEIESTNILSTSIKISESNIDKVKVGTEVKIEVSALGKTYNGYITHVGSTANNGKFEVKIQFENDGDIKLGMTSTIYITI